MTTDNLLQKIEEKVLTLLAEIESLHKEIRFLQKENGTLQSEYNNYQKKIRELISLVDTTTHPVNPEESAVY